MYNLLEYSKNYRKTTGSLWNYYRDEPSNLLSSNSESYKCKTKWQMLIDYLFCLLQKNILGDKTFFILLCTKRWNKRL